MKEVAMEVPAEVWHGCFDDSWRDMITPDAFAHPAKFARGLIQRIIIHGLAAGWWETGDSYVDEESTRFNDRKYNDSERFQIVMSRVTGRRVTWRQLCQVDGCGFMGLE